jgi:formamidopyrimidine-DNA glycosylase
MPEILEIESYRQLADRVVGATISKGWADTYAAKKLPSVSSWARAVKGLRITGTSRRGKLMLIDTSGPTLGMRFGMTGVLLLDGRSGIEGLFYGPHTFKKDWVRGGLELSDGRRLLLHDPRRLGRFEIEPNLDELGPDALSLTKKEFTTAMTISRGGGAAIKARLLDQSVLAGVGNLLGDEMLFRAGIDPNTPTGHLTPGQKDTLYTCLRATLKQLQKRGGSHLGNHMPARTPGGICPQDGGPMRISVIGGRTTYWCAKHQH